MTVEHLCRPLRSQQRLLTQCALIVFICSFALFQDYTTHTMSTLSRQIIKCNILASIINHLRFRGEGGSRRSQTDQTSQFLHALVGYFPLRVVKYERFMLKRTFAHFFNPMLLSSLGVFPLCHAKCFAAPTAGSAWSLT